MTYNDDSGIWELDDPQDDEPIKFRDHISECPNCKNTITEDMDSCPYCGDIIFRYLKDGTFAPRKASMVKIFAIVITLLVFLATLILLLQTVGIL